MVDWDEVPLTVSSLILAMSKDYTKTWVEKYGGKLSTHLILGSIGRLMLDASSNIQCTMDNNVQ
jgi:hypothetical protein